MLNYEQVADPLFVVDAVKAVETADLPKREPLSQPVVLRTNFWKAQWQQKLFTDLTESIEVVPSDWVEEDHGNHLVFPAAIAANKALNQNIQLEQGLNFSSDTAVSDGNRPINKPSPDSSFDEIRAGLMDLIGGQDRAIRRFFVSTGIALFSGVGPAGYGLNTTERHSFDFENLTVAEIDRYLATLSLEELRQTNGAIRWPHDLIQPQIKSVDGIDRNQPDFDRQLTILFLALIGAPIEARNLLLSFGQAKKNEGHSFYNGGVEGNWSYVMKLKSGESAVAKSVSPADCEAISLMMFDNFTNSASYSDLSPEARALYIAANTPSEVWQTVKHRDNVHSMVVRDAISQVVGYQVVRQKLDEQGAPFGNLRRLHVARPQQNSGLGRQMITLAEEFTAAVGGLYLQVPASGGSARFFERIGYQRLPEDNPLGSINPELAARGVDTPLIQMVKSI